jgi:hypothetical protein
MSRNLVFALASEPQEAMLSAAAASQSADVICVPPSAHLETTVMQAMRKTQPPLLLIDIAVLAQLAADAESFCNWKRDHCASADLLLYCSELHAVPAQARAWAQRLGARDLLPGCDLAHWRESLLPSLRAMLGAIDEPAIERAVRTLPPSLDNATLLAQAWRHLDTLRDLGIDPDDLATLMQGPSGVDIRPRAYRTKTYDECFVGDAAVAWFERTFFLEPADALRAGQALLELGYLYHVVREQPFKAGHFFYRVRANTPRLNALDLCEVAGRMRSDGVTIRDRTFRGVTYPACFVGSEAVTWMRRMLALSENEAMTLGERLLDLFVFHHVFDEHHFRNGNFFFRFYRDET